MIARREQLAQVDRRRQCLAALGRAVRELGDAMGQTKGGEGANHALCRLHGNAQQLWQQMNAELHR